MNFIINSSLRLITQNVLLSFSLLFSIAVNADEKADPTAGQGLKISNELSTDLIKLEHKPQAPRFSLPDMQDQPRELSDYLGKPVIISFWATWCPPCRKEIPYFNSAWEKLKNDEVEMLFVNINEGKETIEAYEKKVPIKLTILRDETAGQLANWNMTGLPTTFILDPEGRVVYQAMGERAWDSKEILDKVRALRTVKTPVNTGSDGEVENEKVTSKVET